MQALEIELHRTKAAPRRMGAPRPRWLPNAAKPMRPKPRMLRKPLPPEQSATIQQPPVPGKRAAGEAFHWWRRRIILALNIRPRLQHRRHPSTIGSASLRRRFLASGSALTGRFVSGENKIPMRMTNGRPALTLPMLAGLGKRSSSAAGPIGCFFVDHIIGKHLYIDCSVAVSADGRGRRVNILPSEILRLRGG